MQRILRLGASSFRGGDDLAPSALFTATRSASSITPRFMPCNSSPAPASVMSRKKSTMS